jgi:hypothetical protein
VFEGVEVSTWVKVTDRCDISYFVGQDEVEFKLGSGSNVFGFNATEMGLETFVAQGAAALREMRTGRE